MKVYNYYASLFVGKMHCILSEHTVLVSQIACWTYNTVPFFNIKANYYYKDWNTRLAQQIWVCLYLVKQFTVSCCDTIQAVQLSKGNQRQNVAGKEDYWSQTDLFCVAKIYKMHFYLHFINKMNNVTTQNSFVIINI